MNCEGVTAKLRQYLDNELSEQEQLEIDSHLDKCPHCMAELDALLSEGKYKVPQNEEEKILRILRYHYSLPLELEQQGIARVIASAERILYPRKVASMPYAAAHEDEIDARLDNMMDKFKQNPIRFNVGYTGHLYPLGENSAILEFRKAGKPTSDLDGKKIEISLREDNGEVSSFVGIIQNEQVIIDFAKFGITIEDYNKLKYKLYLDKVIEGTFENE